MGSFTERVTSENKKEFLRKQSFAVRDELRHIPQKAKQKLLETYGKTEEDKEQIEIVLKTIIF